MNITIKDRVAEGDDIFSVEHLEDGRIRLIPTPDAVIEQGTPINKALLQPLVDISPNVYNIDFDIMTGGEISFSEGQSASDLYNDISSGKPVIVTKNNDAFFVPTVRIAGMYILTCVSSYSIHWSFLLGEFSASAVQQEDYALDFVVDAGSSGSWKYRKWFGGRMEAWGVVELTATSRQSNNEIPGTSQVTASCALPNGMLSTDIEYCELSARDYRIFGNMTSVSSVLWGRFTTYESFANSLTLNSSTIPANAMIIGRWK